MRLLSVMTPDVQVLSNVDRLDLRSINLPASALMCLKLVAFSLCFACSACICSVTGLLEQEQQYITCNAMYAEHINELMERARYVPAGSQDEHSALPSWIAAATVVPCSQHGPTSKNWTGSWPAIAGQSDSRCRADLACYQKWQALKHPAHANSTSSSAPFNAKQPWLWICFAMPLHDSPTCPCNC